MKCEFYFMVYLITLRGQLFFPDDSEISLPHSNHHLASFSSSFEAAQLSLVKCGNKLLNKSHKFSKM